VRDENNYTIDMIAVFSEISYTFYSISGYSLDEIRINEQAPGYPIAIISASAEEVYEGATVRFDALESSDYDYSVWTLDYCGALVRVNKTYFNHTFNQTGDFYVQLNCTNATSGNYDIDILKITVIETPNVPIVPAEDDEGLVEALTGAAQALAAEPIYIVLLAGVLILVYMAMSRRKRRR
jgi:PKD repeat protein